MYETISVCICSYKGRYLDASLQSILKQELPPGVAIELILVDNDRDASAAHVAQKIEEASFNIVYSVEDRKGLSYARNKSISLASGQWIAFIDDDEIAAPDWLATLLQTAKTYSADAVVGTVIPEYLSEPPGWLEAGQFFYRFPSATGVKMPGGRTNNALVNRTFVSANRLGFDLSFNTTGGEDTDFFYRLIRAGGKIVGCREAVVKEVIPEERMTMSYVRKKSISGGETYVRIYYKEASASRRVFYFFRSAGILAATSIASLALIPFGKHVYYKPYTVMFRNIGKLKFFFGLKSIAMYQ